jgi:RNA polymerase sigma factor (TIGR02999 family)
MSELTVLFAAARAGDDAAMGKIFSTLYPELKTVARARLRRSDRLTMMDTTVLVHESYLRFQKLGHVELSDRHHFLAYAARVIRTVIVDIVRGEQAGKRGGEFQMQTLDTAIAENTPGGEEDVLAVAQALDSLAQVDSRLASVVEMRYFAGFTETEIASALGVTVRTVRRDWDKARMFLMVALRN